MEAIIEEDDALPTQCVFCYEDCKNDGNNFAQCCNVLFCNGCKEQAKADDCFLCGKPGFKIGPRVIPPEVAKACENVCGFEGIGEERTDHLKFCEKRVL